MKIPVFLIEFKISSDKKCRTSRKEEALSCHSSIVDFAVLLFDIYINLIVNELEFFGSCR